VYALVGVLAAVAVLGVVAFLVYKQQHRKRAEGPRLPTSYAQTKGEFADAVCSLTRPEGRAGRCSLPQRSFTLSCALACSAARPWPTLAPPSRAARRLSPRWLPCALALAHALVSRGRSMTPRGCEPCACAGRCVHGTSASGGRALFGMVDGPSTARCSSNGKCPIRRSLTRRFQWAVSHGRRATRMALSGWPEVTNS
jgi:hypothetical protein